MAAKKERQLERANQKKIQIMMQMRQQIDDNFI